MQKNHHGATNDITLAREDPSTHLGYEEGVGSGVEGGSGVCSQSGSDDGCSVPPYWDSPDAAKLVCQSLGAEALITMKYHAEYAR